MGTSLLDDDSMDFAIHPLSLDAPGGLPGMGALTSERYEILEGCMVRMDAQEPRHVAVVRRLANALRAQVPTGFEVTQHSPLALPDLTMPEPDVAIAPAGPDGEYPRNAVLVAEVADGSLEFDTVVKSRIYAAARVPTFWLVDLTRDEIRVLTEPGGRARRAAYRTLAIASAGEVLRLAKFPSIAIDVAAVLRSLH